VYDLSALITAGIDSWQLKLDPPPAEPHRVTGYLLDATWRPTCAAWTCPMVSSCTLLRELALVMTAVARERSKPGAAPV
jgi:hypothetical protein